MFKKKNEIDTGGLNEIIYLSKNILKLLFIILIIGIVLAGTILLKELGAFKFIGGVLSVLAPLFIGFVVAWLFAPIVDKLTKKGMSRILSSMIVYIVFIAFLLVFFRIFIPIIYNELNELIKTLPSILSKITDFINNIFDKLDTDAFDMNAVKTNILDAITMYGTSISSNLPTTIVSIMSNLVSGLGTIFFGLIIGLYMLFDFDNVTNLLLKVIPVKHQLEVASLVEKIGFEVRKWALLFGLFCGITDLIPYIGPYLGTAVATVVGLTQSPLTGLGVFIIACVVQLVESYVLQPIVMSKATNLHPVIIICGLLIFGHFFGIVGMILATPIMSVIKVILEFIIEKFELFQRKNEEEKAMW